MHDIPPLPHALCSSVVPHPYASPHTLVFVPLPTTTSRPTPPPTPSPLPSPPGVLIITSILWLGMWSGTRPASFKPLWGTLLALGLLLAVLTVYWGFRGRVLPRTCCACVPNYVESRT
jgi:hypothetical protein